MIKKETVSLSSNEKLELISNFSTMFSAGIPISEIVESLYEDAKSNQKKLLECLAEDLKQGRRIHTSFQRFPFVFDSVTVNLIKAAEEAGSLDIILKDLRENIKREIEFSDKIKSAFIYPILIVVVFTAVLLVLLTVVIPKISMVYGRLHVELPLPTKIMLSLSNMLLRYTIPSIVVVMLLAVGLFLLYKKNRRMLLALFSSLPVVSGLVKYIDLARFSRSLFLLLNAGIPITTALTLAQDVVIRRDVANAIAHSKEVVFGGKKLSEGLKNRKHIFPTIMVKIIQAGEKSGSLEESMQETSEYLDYQIANALKTITTLIEPVLLVIVGLLIGGMMLAIIAPIYGLVGQVGRG